ncbi:MAG: aminotransferase class V-fold PLP-dependent enzyme [Pseudomonadota bacterium]
MLAAKSDFIGLEGVAHLASGGQPPLLRAHQGAFDAFARDKARGMAGYDAHWQIGQEVKERLASLTKLEAGDFALIGNASEGIARVVSAIDWQPGDNVVTSALDYASGRYSFARLSELDVEARLVPAEEWRIEPAGLIAACDGRTRLVYVSQVNAHTGQRLDLAALSAPLQDKGIALLVDASHGLGVVPLEGALCDFMVASTYKFLLGPHSGVLAWNRRRWPHFEPLAVGWHAAEAGEERGDYRLLPDARRAEIGNANHLDVYLLKTSLDFLAQVPAADVERHVLDLGGRLRQALVEMGLEVITPEPAAERGPNIAFAHDAARDLAELAAAESILLWGEAGRLRASLHLFVEVADVARYLAWLPKGLAQVEGAR